MSETPSLYNPEEAFRRLQESALFGGRSPEVLPGPFVRPIGHRRISFGDLATPLNPQSSFNELALGAQRLLLGLFQTDFVFIPSEFHEIDAVGFQESNSAEFKIACQIARPAVERFVFGGIEALIDRKNWSAHDAMSMLTELPRAQVGTVSAVVSTIFGSADPRRAAKNLLAQFSIDFLCEGSAVARKVMGNYGPVQSALFRIFMDEYGEGNYLDKHSSLYEELLRSHGLDPTPNRYWEFCLPTAFAVPNLFQYMAINHSHFLQYMGAVYYAETAYYHFCGQVAAMLRAIFGEDTEARYFDVHHTIDQEHSRIAFESIVGPLIARFGEPGLINIAKGYDMFATVNALFDVDFANQVSAMDSADALKQKGLDFAGLAASTSTSTTVVQAGTAVRGKIHDCGVRYVVRDGKLDVSLGLECTIHLDTGLAISIPPGRVYTLSSSSGCVYELIDEKAP